MAFDTKYRPQTYTDVLGQEASVAVLKQFVVEGRGFHQSYVFCGQHGSGKTTLGRILVRALLCDSPVEGAPCDECPSCQTLLRGDPHECFEELDAATKSGKSDLTRIIEDMQYSTASGKRRIYLFDESHRLSKQALDVLLKPMEDNVPGTEEKRLVCIFATTEPEKMVSTIFSRCAPAFVIRSASTEAIADRLAFICEQESITYERDALVLLSEQSESHIRDAIKMLEGVSMLGGVTTEHVTSYLHLGTNDTVLDLLSAVATDLTRTVAVATDLARDLSPTTAYERIAEAAMLIYKHQLGVTGVPSKWDSGRIQALGDQGSAWLNVATRFAAPPHRPTRQTLVLDAVSAHHLFGQAVPVTGVPVVVQTSSAPSPAPSREIPQPALSDDPPVGKIKHDHDTAHKTTSGVWVDPRAIGSGPSDRRADPNGVVEGSPESDSLDPSTFRQLVGHHLRGLRRGRSGRDHMGRT